MSGWIDPNINNIDANVGININQYVVRSINIYYYSRMLLPFPQIIAMSFLPQCASSVVSHVAPGGKQAIRNEME